MELKAFYSVEDLLNLIDQDLQSKGYRQAEGTRPDTNGHKDLAISLTIEKWLEPIITNTPAQLPAPEKPKRKYNKSEQPPSEKELARRAKLSESMRKVRAGQRAVAAAKPDQAHAQEVIAQAQKPTYNTTPLAERVVVRQQVVEQRLQAQEVVAASPAPFQS